MRIALEATGRSRRKALRTAKATLPTAHSSKTMPSHTRLVFENRAEGYERHEDSKGKQGCVGVSKGSMAAGKIIRKSHCHQLPRLSPRAAVARASYGPVSGSVSHAGFFASGGPGAQAYRTFQRVPPNRDLSADLASLGE